ncbi:hypothetical protein KY284_027540 [Solanum tuberosum]|nr:hypothetical protein KY284_027540 [Solanum tuberosum]
MQLDKASILEDAIKYIGELQGRVSSLEEAARTIKSSTNLIETTHATLVHKQYSHDDHVDDLESKRHEDINDIKIDENVDIKVQDVEKAFELHLLTIQDSTQD